MTVDEFLRRVSAQPEVRETRRRRVMGPHLRAEVEAGRVTRLDEVMSHPDHTWEIRPFRFGHLVGDGVPEGDITNWQTRHPDLPLPTDLRALLARLDGIHLWADLDRKRSYWGILPLEEWQDAALVGWAPLFSSPPRGMVAISYHENSDFFLVLDTATSEYRWHDLGDFRYPKVVAHAVSELLDWLWQEAAELAPPTTRA